MRITLKYFTIDRAQSQIYSLWYWNLDISIGVDLEV